MSLGPTVIQVSVAGSHIEALNLVTASVPYNFASRTALVDGTGAGQAKAFFSDVRTLAASASESLSLNGGSLKDAFGNVLSFTKIKALIIFASPANTNDVVVGNAGSDPVVGGPFGSSGTQTFAVHPGDVACFVSSTANGVFEVTPSTAENLQVANGSSGTGVTYTIIVIGV